MKDNLSKTEYNDIFDELFINEKYNTILLNKKRYNEIMKLLDMDNICTESYFMVFGIKFEKWSALPYNRIALCFFDEGNKLKEFRVVYVG